VGSTALEMLLREDLLLEGADGVNKEF